MLEARPFSGLDGGIQQAPACIPLRLVLEHSQMRGRPGDSVGRLWQSSRVVVRGLDDVSFGGAVVWICFALDVLGTGSKHVCTGDQRAT